jgi:hypothetical protein
VENRPAPHDDPAARDLTSSIKSQKDSISKRRVARHELPWLKARTRAVNFLFAFLTGLALGLRARSISRPISWQDEYRRLELLVSLWVPQGPLEDKLEQQWIIPANFLERPALFLG